MVITGATGRHLRSYPHARFLDHEDLLKRPLLDDHLSRDKATVKRTLGVVCDLCVVFRYFVLFMSWVIYAFVFILTFILACNLLAVKKLREI